MSFFCIPSSFLFLPLGASYVLPVCFELAFGRPFLLLFIKFCVRLTIKKKVVERSRGLSSWLGFI